MRTFITMTLCAILAGCGGSSSSEKATTPFSADGTVMLDGEAATIEACDLEGSGIDQAVRLTLASGTTLTVPLHESGMRLKRPGSGDAVMLACEVSRKTEASNVWLATELEGSCSGDDAKLEFALKLECGTKGPSNQLPKEKD
jgi:hypothetical protein